jgi:hypothetical protein
MANARPSPQPKTPRPARADRAAAAFVDFVALGDDRTLPKLAEMYRNSTKPVPTRQLSRLKIWSSKYNWIPRIEQFEDELAEAELRKSARLDADTFHRSSRLLNERMHYAHPGDTEVVIKMRESVRKPAPKSGTSVNVNVSVEVQQLAEQLAAKIGVPVEDLMGDAQQLADGIMPGYQA